MKLPFNKSILFIVITLALMASVLGVTPAFADEETPPAPTTGDLQPPTQEPALTQEPITTEAPIMTEESAPTEPPATTSTEEAASVAEVLEQLPEDTAVVVVDASGDTIPLVTQEAANAFVSGDPMWCPFGVTPGNDLNDACTAKHSSLLHLIDDLVTNASTYTGSGTIYIAWDYNADNPASPDYGSDIVFDYGEVLLTDLVVQGGWDFASNSLWTSPSNLTGINSLNFLDWGGYDEPASLTINDVLLNNAGWHHSTSVDSGLYAGSWDDSANGDVALKNVSINSSRENGALISTYGNVNVTNSMFNDNPAWGSVNYSGLAIYSGGNVTLNSVTANENSAGVTVESSGNVSVANSTFSANIYGLRVTSGGSITLNNVTTNGKAGGANLLANDEINITNSTFSNSFQGLIASSKFNNITLNQVTVNGNLIGAWVLANKTVNITNSTFNNNIEIGALLNTPGDVSVICSEFKGNGKYGIFARDVNGSLNLANVTFAENKLSDYQYNGSPTITTVVCNPATGGDGQRSQKTALYILVKQNQEQLPGTLETGNTFASAVQVILTAQGEQVSNLAITLSFPIPDGIPEDKLAVMFWNGVAWVEVPGGSVVNGYFVITVGKPGYYVLVSR